MSGSRAAGLASGALALAIRGGSLPAPKSPIPTLHSALIDSELSLEASGNLRRAGE